MPSTFYRLPFFFSDFWFLISDFRKAASTSGGKDRRAVERGIAAAWEGGSEAGRAAPPRPNLG
jgi:hypothetical protein